MLHKNSIEILPMDEYNQTLVCNVHPSDWVNPNPQDIYNLVVIGAGTAGLITAAGAAGLGAKVALIERHLMGGDCLNIGCVPSKCIIRSARAAGQTQELEKLGVRLNGKIEADFPAVMQRMRKIRSSISQHDSAARYKSLGVDLFIGEAKFSNSNEIEVSGKKLKFKKAVIATGARAAVPKIPGIGEAGYLTNATVFNLTTLPKRLLVIGAGPIGCELAQTFSRLGSQVHLFEAMHGFLPREDRDAAAIVEKTFQKEKIHSICCCKIEKVEKEGAEKIIYFVAQHDGEKAQTIVVDEILLGVGRVPNVEGLNLETVGVKYDARSGVETNDYLQTTNPNIYAAGDITLKHKFTHAADASARIVLQNALFFKSKKLSSVVIPWCTYTDPEIAHVGLYEHEAKEKGIAVETFIREMKNVDRAIAEGEEDGLLKVHLRKGTDQILGATLVARHAGEMISEITLAMTHGIGLGKIASVLHPYPTQSEIIKQIADAYNRTRLTPSIKKLMQAWLKYNLKF